MTRLADAIERIKALECPTGEFETRVSDIFRDYEVAKRDEVSIHRVKSLNQDGTETYRVHISGHQEDSVLIRVRAGLDDYVAKVIDVYRS